MRLTIKDFSVLKDVDINLDDVTVIIGEQASGKSLTARVLFFFVNYFLPTCISEAASKDNSLKFNDDLSNTFYKIFPKKLLGGKNFSLVSYGIFSKEEPASIKSDYIENKIYFIVPEETKKSLKKAYLGLQKMDDLLKSIFNENSITKKLLDGKIISHGNDFLKSAFTLQYIPAGRSLFSTIDKNIYFLTGQDGFVIDPVIREFGQDYLSAKRQLNDAEYNNPNFDLLAAKVIKGEWQVDGEDREFITGNTSNTPLTHASSGQQEALPLVLMLKKELATNTNAEKKSNKIIIIEEPEAHLFPASQRAIVDLIFQVKKQCPHVKFLITTHSPYILTCINNEIMKAKRDQVTVGVDSYFMADGVSTRIFDDETGLINGEKLDEISGEISDEFYQLLGAED